MASTTATKIQIRTSRTCIALRVGKRLPVTERDKEIRQLARTAEERRMVARQLVGLHAELLPSSAPAPLRGEGGVFSHDDVIAGHGREGGERTRRDGDIERLAAQ